MKTNKRVIPKKYKRKKTLKKAVVFIAMLAAVVCQSFWKELPQSRKPETQKILTSKAAEKILVSKATDNKNLYDNLFLLAGSTNLPAGGVLLRNWLYETEQNLEFAAETEVYIEQMTMHEKICQMMFVNTENLVSTHDVTKADAEVAQALADYPIGGIMMKTKNIRSKKQTKKLLKALQNDSETGLFLAVDEEGGTVSRVMSKLGTIDGDVISSMYEYKDMGTDIAYQNARTIGENLAYYGFNLDFAPVADVWSNPDNTVIGKRAYSDDFSQAAELIPYAVEGFHESGMLCTLKHFPGHGNTEADSHYGNAYVEESREQLEQHEIQPFYQGIQAGVDFVMIGHMIVSDIADVPASLSEEIVTDMLRKELGFCGIIITDSFQMEAITDYYESGAAEVLAVQAGVDMILEPENLACAVETLEQAVADGTLTEERIDASVRRILIVKRKNNI